MKKKLLMLIATVMVALSANAFTFDGIDITGNVQDVMREIAKRGYVYNEDKQCLEGNCQGTTITMSFNLTEVKKTGKIGQMIVTIPIDGGNDHISAVMANAQTIFNVIYHQVSKDGGVTVYQADPDGTTMKVLQTPAGIKLVYNTPYYKPAK